MSFSRQLAHYMDRAAVTAAELAQSADLSPSSISRYLNGKQIPSDAVIEKLAKALAEHAPQGSAGFSEEEAFHALRTAASGISIDYETCIANLRQLLALCNISNHELARLLSYDPSYISRVLSGTRKPANLPLFLTKVSDYTARKFFDTPKRDSILLLIGAQDELRDAAELAAAITLWLGESHEAQQPRIAGFLDKLDAFDLNEFLASIHFDEMKVPAAPFQFPTTKTYHGIDEMMQAELDFLRSAVLSKSHEDIILYSDMPMGEMSRNAEFPKKWMAGIALLLRKGQTLHMIHDVHRPLDEMLLGLESWIPMYMTGQVRPYYLKEQTNDHFLHFIRSAGTVAIAGEAIAGKHAHGRYVVSKNKDDVAYYRRRATDLLHRASPLMQIYRVEQASSFREQMLGIREREKSFLHIGSAPPLFTMSRGLLDDILARNDVPAEEAARIVAYQEELARWADEFCVDGTYAFELEASANDDGQAYPVRLPLAELFPNLDICHSDETHRRHVEEAIGFADAHVGFTLRMGNRKAFRNIEILICPGKCVLVSKGNAPAIHFLIFHPKMVRAIERFAPPIVEL